MKRLREKNETRDIAVALLVQIERLLENRQLLFDSLCSQTAPRATASSASHNFDKEAAKASVVHFSIYFPFAEDLQLNQIHTGPTNCNQSDHTVQLRRINSTGFAISANLNSCISSAAENDLNENFLILDEK